MSKLGKILGVAALAVSLVVAPAFAQQPPDDKDGGRQLEESVRQSIENILRAIEGLIDSVPIYEMPEILDNGDIIIRRKKRAPESDPEPAKPAPNGDSSST